MSFIVEWLHDNDVKVISDLDGLCRADLDNTHHLCEAELLFLEQVGANRWSTVSLPSGRSNSPKKRGYSQGERRSYQLQGATDRMVDKKKVEGNRCFRCTRHGPFGNCKVCRQTAQHHQCERSLVVQSARLCFSRVVPQVAPQCH